jgi:hypothetical protein
VSRLDLRYVFVKCTVVSRIFEGTHLKPSNLDLSSSLRKVKSSVTSSSDHLRLCREVTNGSSLMENIEGRFDVGAMARRFYIQQHSFAHELVG